MVNNRAVMKKLSDESKRSLLTELERNPASPLRRYEAMFRDGNFNVFYDAPCLVYIVGPKSLSSLAVDCSLAACYFMFAAAARGLGSCWVGLGSSVADPGLREEIGLPEDCAVVAPIIVGYPASIPEPRDREAPRVLKVLS